MAGLPANSTSRYFVKYFSAGRTHKASFRYTQDSGQPTALFIAQVGDFFETLNGIMSGDFVFVSASYIAADTDLELPCAIPHNITHNDVRLTMGDSPRYMSFVGRGLSGHKVRVYVYGIAIDPADNVQTWAADYRVMESEEPRVTAALEALFILGAQTIAGDFPVWHRYANIGYNVHYQKKARRG